MATYETKISVSATWLAGSLVADAASEKVTKITDGKNSETKFEVGEELTITTVDDGDYKVNFRGTITINGVEYPVVDISTGLGTITIAVGLPRSLAPATLPAVDASGPFTVCFFPETLIATPSGERKVEQLVSGDLVLIGDYGAIPATWLGRKFARAVSVKWIGRQTVSTLFGPAERLMPVRFAAGSLGGGGGATSSSA